MSAEWELIDPGGEEEPRYLFSVATNLAIDEKAGEGAGEGESPSGGDNSHGAGSALCGLKVSISASDLSSMEIEPSPPATREEREGRPTSPPTTLVAIELPSLKRRRLSVSSFCTEGGLSPVQYEDGNHLMEVVEEGVRPASSSTDGEEATASPFEPMASMKDEGSNTSISSGSASDASTMRGSMTLPSPPPALITGPCMRIEASYSAASGEHKCLVFRSDRRGPIAKLIWTKENEETAHVKSVFVHESVRGKLVGQEGGKCPPLPPMTIVHTPVIIWQGRDWVVYCFSNCFLP